MRRLTDALLAHPGIDEILDVKDAHGDSALSLAVNKGHTYLALRLLEKGASLTPDAGEALGLDNVLTAGQRHALLVLARNVAAIRWLIVRSDSDPKVLLSRDGKGRTPRDLVRLGDAIGHRIHLRLRRRGRQAMGLTDGFVDVGLTRPEDIVEQLQWEKYERAVARHRRRVRARQRARCEARFGCAGCSLCGCGASEAESRGSRSPPSRAREVPVRIPRRATRWRPVPVPSSRWWRLNGRTTLAAMKKPGSRRGCKPWRGGGFQF